MVELSPGGGSVYAVLQRLSEISAAMMMMSGRHDGDAGGEYLETEHQMGVFVGGNRPTLSKYPPFFPARHPLSASVRFRNLPSVSVFWQQLVFLGDGVRRIITISVGGVGGWGCISGK